MSKRKQSYSGNTSEVHNNKPLRRYTAEDTYSIESVADCLQDDHEPTLKSFIAVAERKIRYFI